MVKFQNPDFKRFLNFRWSFWSDGLDPIGHQEPANDPSKRCTFALFR